jgi:hypothetical protein
MMFEYILKIQLSSILRSDIGRGRAEVSHLRKSVDADKDGIETILEREFNGVVH